MPAHLVSEDELPERVARAKKSLTHLLGWPLDYHIRRKREHRRLTAFKLSCITIIRLRESEEVPFSSLVMFDEMQGFVRVCTSFALGL